MDKLVALVVAKKGNKTQKNDQKESIYVLVKLSIVHDCLLDGNLHILLLKRKFPSFVIVCFGTYVYRSY